MRLGDAKFLNLFALLASSTNPDRDCDRWTVGAVEWSRERTSRRGPGYSFQIELHTLIHGGRRGWMLLCGHETWWDAGKRDAFRNGRWVHLSRGARGDVIAWFKERESELR